MNVTVTVPAAGSKSRVTKTFTEYEGKMESASKHDHLVGLYKLGANRAERKDKASDDYWYERNADECKFQPKINKPRLRSSERISPSNPSTVRHAPQPPQSVKNIKGYDKVLQRLEKGRQDADFRKRMTERSNATAITIKSKKAIATVTKKNDNNRPATSKNTGFSYGMDRSKYKSGFEIDGSQIVPKKKTIPAVERALARPRTPLHVPKQEPKFKKSTLVDLIQKENEINENMVGRRNKAKPNNNGGAPEVRNRRGRQDRVAE